MKKVSVIVPIYNVEPYLERCILSLVHQTLEDIEILLVNDGSTDQSAEIMETYIAQYPDKLFGFHKVNGGLSDARNYGLAHANGEYIGFVDSDDYVDESMFESLYNKAKSEDFDIVACDLTYIYEDHTMPAYANLKKDLHTSKEIKTSMTYVYPAAWNKIYHHTLFEKDVKFTKGIWFEDVEMLYRLYPYIHSIGYVPEAFYQYIQRSNAITSTFDERLFDYIKNWETVLLFYKEHDLFDTYYYELQYSCTRYLYATFLKAASHYEDKSMYRKAVNEAKAFIKSNFRNPYKNPYFYCSGIKGVYLLFFNTLFANVVYNKAH